MRTGEPTEVQRDLYQLAAESHLLGFPGGHVDAYTNSFAHSPARDCFEHSGSSPQRRPSEHSNRNGPRCSADTMRPVREVDWRSPTKRR